MSKDHHHQPDTFQARFLLPQFWGIWLWLAIQWLIGRLPYPAIKAIGHGTGWLAYKLLKRRRKIALRNLGLCLPEKSQAERQRIALASFKGAGLTLFESGLIWWARHRRVLNMHRVEGLEHLQACSGQPTLLLGMHNSCLEMAYGPLSLQHSLRIMFRINNNPLWEWASQLGRRRFNLVMVSNRKARAFLRYLRAGNTGVLYADHDLGRKNSIFVPFFGIPTATVTTPSDFARLSGAKVLFACGRREAGGYVVEISPPWENFPSGNIEADICRFSQAVEAKVRQYPEEYIWMHRRFKTRPEGEASLYQSLSDNAG
ncbi:MAG: hypothetical protein OIF38_09545 [Cellvibrionaceae bacterium]|nr:hypothetical protein [Cellvibrionaceae bacterium]